MLLERLDTLFDRLRPTVISNAHAQIAPFPAFTLFASFTDGVNRAKTVTASGTSAEEALEALFNATKQISGDMDNSIRWLRIDWVDTIAVENWATIRNNFLTIKRNYFRYGLSLNSAFTAAFLETELNANAMLYGGPKVVSAIVNEANFLRYAKLRHGLGQIDFSDNNAVYVFTTCAAFTASDETGVCLIGDSGLTAGRRVIEKLSEPEVFGLIDRGSRFLSTQVQDNGRFIYGWHPCFDREIPAYNSLRHASTLYSMIESWAVTGDQTLKNSIDRSLAYLTETLIKTVRHDGEDLAFLVDQPGEIKLGGNAVCLLALVKYCEVTHTNHYLDLLDKLAAGILFMQNTETGIFNHVLHYPSLELKEAFRIIYYDGEAAFGLMRLYAITRDERWLSAVEKAFTYFLANEHWRAHDHWLSYAVNELTLYHPRPEYFTFGIQNFIGYLDFVSERITTFPTLLELMMAAHKMIVRIQADPSLVSLLSAVDLNKFYSALETRAHHLLNGHFWPELAMFYAKPERIVGSFFIRHHAFRVRIDDVEHYLSGFVAYRSYLLAQSEKPAPELLRSDAFNKGPTQPKDVSAIGFLSYPLNPNNFKEIQTLATKAFHKGLNVFYASYKDCVLEAGKMNGYAFDGKQWHKSTFSIPEMIDNAPPRNMAEAALYTKLAAKTFLTCHKLGGKQKTLDLLAQNEKTSDFLIPHALVTTETAKEALAHSAVVILKPLRGNRGRGVFLLKKADAGSVMVSTNSSVQTLDAQQFEVFITERSNNRWMLQNYISSTDKDGLAFDIRVPVMRGHSGRFEVARSYVRLGAGSITSNLATGGKALNILPFLSEIYGEEDALKLITDLENAAFLIADALQNHYPYIIDALGCDFGIADGKIFLFEVNSYPGIKGCLEEASDLKTDFYRSLLNTKANHSDLSVNNDKNWINRIIADANCEKPKQARPEKSLLPIENVAHLADYFNGKWLVEPAHDWQPRKMVASIKRAKPGDFVPIFSLKEPLKIGSTRRSVREIGLLPDICLITDRDKLDLGNLAYPILKVDSIEHTVETWVSDLRNAYQGLVFAITGSVGKSTTTRMLSSALKRRGACLVSIFNNLTPSIYRNACLFESQDFAVFEVAQGSLPKAAEILKPNIAILLSASPVHMERHLTLKDLVACKAQIFTGATEGDIAVINRDIPHYEVAELTALENKRKLITFGWHECADFKLLSCTLERFSFAHDGKIFDYKLPSSGEHIAMNCLAIIAAIHGAGMDWSEFADHIQKSGEPPKGRGNIERHSIGGKNITIIDQAYNANPASVEAAILMLNNQPVHQGGRRILILSDMLELGVNEKIYHEDLAEKINANKPDIIILAGDLVYHLLGKLIASDQVIYTNTIPDIFPMLKGLLKDGDTVMFKGSSGTGLHDGLKNFLASSSIQI